ncbi:MAG: histidinol-phosphatase [Spirochaetaceae bacterium]|jgi:histidinol-phosphatase (PHP family)|nr:histidinol-phosphatase [Spirochaetaceae bacterium]
MVYSCIHTHTTFCDGKDDIETFCRTAYERGFVSLGFSAHAPIRKKTGLDSDWHLAEDRLPEYLEGVFAARRRWEGKIAVYAGLEVDYIRGMIGPADKEFQSLGLDYIIGSVHYVIPPDGAPPFTVDEPPEAFSQKVRDHFGGDGAGVMETYWNAMAGMIRAGGFDLLAHPDLIKKNNGRERYFSRESETYLTHLKKTAGLAAGSGVVVEVNTGGLIRGWTDETYPELRFLRFLKEKNTPVIITADAHRAEHLGGYYAEARKTLLAAGYTQAVLFAGRTQGRPVWKEDPL